MSTVIGRCMCVCNHGFRIIFPKYSMNAAVFFLVYVVSFKHSGQEDGGEGEFSKGMQSPEAVEG